MRGIGRVLAVTLLVGGVGGAAAFARHSGSESTARIVDLAAPPLQHVTAPGDVLIAPMPAPIRVKAAEVAPARRVKLPQATLQRPVQASQPQNRPQPPSPAPTPPPAQTASPPVPAPAPIQTPEPPRVLAAVQPVPAPGPSKGKGHGHAWGHLEHDDAAPPLPPVTDLPAPPPSSPDNSTGDEQGHGSGHDKNGGPKHSGD